MKEVSPEECVLDERLGIFDHSEFDTSLIPLSEIVSAALNEPNKEEGMYMAAQQLFNKYRVSCNSGVGFESSWIVCSVPHTAPLPINVSYDHRAKLYAYFLADGGAYDMRKGLTITTQERRESTGGHSVERMYKLFDDVACEIMLLLTDALTRFGKSELSDTRSSGTML